MLMGKLPYRSDLLRGLNRVAAEQGIKAGVVQVIGSLRRARLSFFDQKTRAYQELDFDAPHEIVSGTGNISLRGGDGAVMVHLHLAVADSTGKVVGGHCLEGCSIFALEYAIWPFAGPQLRRVLDHPTGLHLWEEALYTDEQRDSPVRPGLDSAD